MRFYWNGIKAADGKLQTAHYSKDSRDGSITIFASEYSGFSSEIRAAFTVKNNSDPQTDYFEHDSIDVAPSHPLYAAVLEAHGKQQAHNEKKIVKQKARWEAKRAAVAK